MFKQDYTCLLIYPTILYYTADDGAGKGKTIGDAGLYSPTTHLNLKNKDIDKAIPTLFIGLPLTCG